MKIADVRKNAYAMPLTSPAFPPGPYRFIDREYLIITYRTDKAALEAVVPEPLTFDEPIVKYEFIRMPNSTGFGDYTESGQVIPVRYNGVEGGYTHAMFLNDGPPIYGGRELWGFPKKYAQPSLGPDKDTFVGTLDYGAVRVATGTMGYKHRAADLRAVAASLAKPNYLLKIIPHVDGSPRILELVDYRLEDVTVKGAWTGPAALDLRPHALAPIADLPVREIISATHILADLTLGLGKVIYEEVFDRSDAFDPNVDPIVRVEAARVRDKLREYYGVDGRSDPIRIDLPKGSYTPHIEFRQAPIPEPQPEQPGASIPDRHLDPTQPQLAVTHEPPSSAPPWLKSLIRWQMAVPALALLLLLAAVGTWHYRNPTVPAPERTAENPVVEVPKGPAIAVLPFVNLSGDPKQEYFSDGLTEDILTELSRARDLRVLARNTTFQYKSKAVDVMKLGRELKARYVLEGSIQRTGDRLRVSAQLIDTETGSHVWADRFDREMADVFVVQDEIVNRIVAKIAGSYGAIENTEAKSVARKNLEQIQAYDLVLRARDVMHWYWTGETFRTARATLNQAIALDPSNAQARRELAWLAVVGWVFQLDETPEPAQEITAQATKAVQLDPADARARMVAASAYFFTKQLDLFAHETDQALALAPYDAEILAALACMISSAGDHQRGVALAKKANALNADAARGWYHSTVYTAYYLDGDYARALEVARQNTQQEMFYSYLEIIPIYGQLGMKQEALEAWHNLRKVLPSPSAQTFENWWRLWNIRGEEVAKLMDGVYKSGVLGVDAKPSQ